MVKVGAADVCVCVWRGVQQPHPTHTDINTTPSTDTHNEKWKKKTHLTIVQQRSNFFGCYDYRDTLSEFFFINKQTLEIVSSCERGGVWVHINGCREDQYHWGATAVVIACCKKNHQVPLVCESHMSERIHSHTAFVLFSLTPNGDSHFCSKMPN